MCIESFTHLWEQGILQLVGDEFYDLLTAQLILGWHTVFPSPYVFISNWVSTRCSSGYHVRG